MPRAVDALFFCFYLSPGGCLFSSFFAVVSEVQYFFLFFSLLQRSFFILILSPFSRLLTGFCCLPPPRACASIVHRDPDPVPDPIRSTVMVNAAFRPKPKPGPAAAHIAAGAPAESESHDFEEA